MFTDNDGNRDWKKILYHGRSAFVVLLSIAVLAGGALFAYSRAHDAYVNYSSATDYRSTDGAADVTVTIPAGATGSGIGDILAAADVVKSRKGFLKAFNANDRASSIQAGTYRLRTQISSARAVEMLLDPANQSRHQVTVPEGLWMQDQFAVLSKRTGIPVAQFQAAAKNPQALGFPAYVTNAEGFLFPSTYEVGEKPTATSILRLMAAQYNKVAAENNLVARARQLGHTPVEIMTIASILQAEATAKDAPMVAGIIQNRLDNAGKGKDPTNFPTQLQLDSTAHFQLKIAMNKPLPANFQNIDPTSSYNTYRHIGLPDGPINAPGLVFIKAALNPTKTANQFWLTTNFTTGQTKFATTYADHLKNQREWEAWCKTATDKSGCPG